MPQVCSSKCYSAELVAEYLGCKTWVFQVRASKCQLAEFSQANLAIYLFVLCKFHDDAAIRGRLANR